MKPPAPGPLDKTLPAPDPAQVQVIRTYGPGRFLISDRDWREPVLVTPTVTTPWKVMRAELKAAGLALEVVDTGSACRIYNVLLAEGRRVAAALIPL